MVDRRAENGRVDEEAEWGPGVGARPRYQSQEVAQQPRAELLQVKGGAVG